MTSFTSDANTANYSYDATGQVVGVDNSTLPDEGHTYDANGNRTGTGYAVGAGNRQLSDPRYTYTYDDEGNRTANVDAITGERTEYVWETFCVITAKFENSLPEPAMKSNLNPSASIRELSVSRRHTSITRRRFGHSVLASGAQAVRTSSCADRSLNQFGVPSYLRSATPRGSATL